MLPDSAYPGPLPLQREAAFDLLDRLGEFESAAGAFLTFVKIPVVPRHGVYRFAGASRCLAAAIRRVDEFGARFIRLRRPIGLLRHLLEDCGVAYDGKGVALPDSGYRYHLPAGEPHRLVLASESWPPYEEVGACVVELAMLAGSAYENRAPEAESPKEWFEQESPGEPAQPNEPAGPRPIPRHAGSPEDSPF